MKKLPLIIGVVAIIIVVGGFLLFKSRSGQNKTNLSTSPTPTAMAEKKEEGVIVALTATQAGRAVLLKIDQITAEVTSVDYELAYETKAGLPRGVLGKAETKGRTSISREILLGTCSKNVCVYDEGVKKISLNLRFNRPSGQPTSFSQDFEL